MLWRFVTGLQSVGYTSSQEKEYVYGRAETVLRAELARLRGSNKIMRRYVRRATQPWLLQGVLAAGRLRVVHAGRPHRQGRDRTPCRAGTPAGQQQNNAPRTAATQPGSYKGYWQRGGYELYVQGVLIGRAETVSRAELARLRGSNKIMRRYVRRATQPGSYKAYWPGRLRVVRAGRPHRQGRDRVPCRAGTPAGQQQNNAPLCTACHTAWLLQGVLAAGRLRVVRAGRPHRQGRDRTPCRTGTPAGQQQNNAPRTAATQPGSYKAYWQQGDYELCVQGVLIGRAETVLRAELARLRGSNKIMRRYVRRATQPGSYKEYWQQGDYELYMQGVLIDRAETVPRAELARLRAHATP